MSASREKKSRQNKVEELTEKQALAAQQAAQEKRKSILYTVIGVVCAVLVAALLIWNSGLFQNRDAVKVNGETYTTEEVNYFYNNMLMQYYYSAMLGSAANYDPQVDPAEQVYDEETGKTWHAFFVDEAVDDLTEVKILVAKAEAEGVKLSDDGKQYVKESMDSLASTSANSGFTSTTAYLKAAYGSGMSKGLYKQLLTETTLASEMAADYAEQLTYTDEQLEEHYAEHADDMDLFTYSFAKFSGAPETTTDENGEKVEPTDKEKSDAEAHAYTKAEALRAKLAAGGNFAELVAELAEDKSVTSNENVTASGATVLAALDSWLKEDGRQTGDVGLVKLDADCYVVKFQGRARDTEVAGDVRHILVAAEQDEGATEPTEAQYDAAKAKAEQMLADWKAGAATEDSFAELAKAESADPGSAANGGLYEDVSSATGFIPEFTEWVVDPAREVGDTGIVKNTMSSTKGWHILYYSAKGEPVWKTTVEAELANEDTTAWLDELTASAQVERLEALNNL
ncbi:MAG: peptidylprolyl isomerase [Oscillospiraceae bacterium]|nr:peptidylprolyl isomerase [Oscillospiraceae bacterium]